MEQSEHETIPIDTAEGATRTMTDERGGDQTTEPTTPLGAPAPGAPTGGGGTAEAGGPAGYGGGGYGGGGYGSGGYGSGGYGSGGYGGASGYGPAGPAPGVRLLRRSQVDRKAGGVCGGLGAYFGIDPLVFRVVFAVLAVFGGSGILLYALGWLLMPDEGQHDSEAQRLLQGHGSVGATLAVVAVVVGVLVFGLGVHIGHAAGAVSLVLLVLLGLAVFGLVRRSPATGPHAAAPTTPPPGSGWTPPPGAFGQTPGTAYTTGFATAPPVPPVPPVPPAGWSPSPWVPPQPTRPKSYLGRLVFSALVVAVGIMVAVSASGHDVSVRVGAAVLLAIVGAGLVVGAFVGRARGLVLLGLLLTAVALTPSTHVDLRGGAGSRTWTPGSAADAAAEPYRLGVGNAWLDLSSATPAAGTTTTVHVSVGVGHLQVTVPSGVHVHVDGRSSTGTIQLPVPIFNDPRRGGVGRHVIVDLGPPASSAVGTINLDAQVGVGFLEVVQS